MRKTGFGKVAGVTETGGEGRDGEGSGDVIGGVSGGCEFGDTVHGGEIMEETGEGVVICACDGGESGAW